MAAQEQANSIVEGSAAAQQGPQGPRQPQYFVDLSGGREKQGASRKCSSSNGYAMAPLLGDYSFCFFLLQGRQEYIINVSNFVIINSNK